MNLSEKKKKFNGVKVATDLKIIEEISVYNYNYYSYEGSLILGVSNDEDETEWFLISNSKRFDLIGYSYSSNRPEIIRVEEAMHT